MITMVLLKLQLVLMLLFFLYTPEIEGLRIATRIRNKFRPTRRPPPPTQCLPKCICTRKRWFSKQMIDCSYRNLSQVPRGAMRLNAYAGYLNLRGNNITQISHNDFEQLSGLHGLDLRDNPVEYLESAVFFKLHNLKELLVTAHKLHHFAFHGLNDLVTLRLEGADKLEELHVALLKPLTKNLVNLTITKSAIVEINNTAIAGMEKLEALDLSDNAISSIASDAFSGTDHLETITLKKNKLTRFPRNFIDAHLTRVFDISYNMISTIPEKAFFWMKKLTNLDFSHNLIAEIEQNAFKGATLLSGVNAQNNKLKTLPKELIPEMCGSLTFVDLSFNSIENFEIPEKDVCRITTLKLAGTSLKKLNVSTLKQLRTLDLSKNCDFKFTSDSANMYIREFDLSESCLSELPPYFNTSRYSRYVDKINLSGNRFTNFTNPFTIRNLNMSSNLLTTVTLKYSSYQRFGVYDFSNNFLTKIENKTTSAYSKNMRVSTLIMRNNSLTSLAGLSWITGTVLDVSYNKLSEFVSKQFRAKPTTGYYSKLITLNLAGNQLTKISPSSFSTLPDLKYLDLSGNRIASIDNETFLGHRYLQKLNIAQNALKEIPSALSHLIALKTLDASHNKITTVPANVFDKMKNMQTISLKGNQLVALPPKMSKFVKNYWSSVILDLSENKLRCSCNLTILVSYYGNIRPIGKCMDMDNKKEIDLRNKVVTLKELTNTSCSLCPVDPCQYRGTCKDTNSGFTCQCNSEFTGRLCEHPRIDCGGRTCGACLRSKCRNGGTCIEGEKQQSYTCQCPVGFNGTYCQFPACSPNPCQNSGVCTVKFSKFSCQCPSSYAGKRCGVDQSACNSIYCHNNGACTRSEELYTCRCYHGYSGKFCESQIRTPGKVEQKSAGSSKSATIAIVLLAILLVALIVVLVVFVRRSGACRHGMKNDRIELVNDFD